MALVAYYPKYGGYGFEKVLLEKIRQIAPDNHLSNTYVPPNPTNDAKEDEEYARYELAKLIPRHDKYLVKAIELVGEYDYDTHPKGTMLTTQDVERGYSITEYDGKETVNELEPKWTLLTEGHFV